MLLLVGQVARDAVGREGFQELDYAAVFGSMAKWVGADRRRRRGSPSSSRAPTPSRPPGGRAPSCSRCPRTCSPTSPTSPTRRRTGRPPPPPPGAGGDGAPGRAARGRRAPAGDRRRGRLDRADGRATSPRSREAQRVPVAASCRCQDYVDNRSPAYAGHAALGIDPALARAHPRRRRAAGDRRAPERDHDRRLHARCGRRRRRSASSTCTPTRASSGPCYQPELGDRLRSRGVRRRRRELRAGGRRRAGSGCWRSAARRVRAQPARGRRAPRRRCRCRR